MAESTTIAVADKKPSAISLKDVSPEARELLSVIDVDGDGILEVEELKHAANMLAEYKVRAAAGAYRAVHRCTAWGYDVQRRSRARAGASLHPCLPPTL
jgi:hypothetical protein